MGAMVTNTAGHALTNPSVAKIVSGLLFPFGLIMVILTGAELFTGNCLITISVLEKKVNWLGMLRNWFYVYLGNFIGSLLLAMACAYSGPMNLNNNGRLHHESGGREVCSDLRQRRSPRHPV